MREGAGIEIEQNCALCHTPSFLRTKRTGEVAAENVTIFCCPAESSSCGEKTNEQEVIPAVWLGKKSKIPQIRCFTTGSKGRKIEREKKKSLAELIKH